MIIGDVSTPLSTSQEAFMMGRANEIHASLLSNNSEPDGFLLDNFEFLQGALASGAFGAGVASDAWSRYLKRIKTTLEDIEQLHRDYLRESSAAAKDNFYSKRAVLFRTLEGQLENVAAYGAGLRREGSTKRMLGISTKSYLRHGEIAGYADKVNGVAKAARLIKRGSYVGVALNVASTALDIEKACTLGREEQCTHAKYVKSSALVGNLTGSAVGGGLGGAAGTFLCVTVLGLASGGPGAFVCAVVGGAVGGLAGGAYFEPAGEALGTLLYEAREQ